MAKLTPEQWEQARIWYEVEKLNHNQIAKKLGIPASTVARKSDRDGWNKEKMQTLISDNVLANKWLENLEQKTQKETQKMQKAIANAVREGLQLFGIGQTMADVADSLSRTAKAKALSIEASGVGATAEQFRDVFAISQTVNEAAKIPMKMWEVANKTPDTAIQINNSNEVKTPSRIELVAPSVNG